MIKIIFLPEDGNAGEKKKAEKRKPHISNITNKIEVSILEINTLKLNVRMLECLNLHYTKQD